MMKLHYRQSTTVLQILTMEEQQENKQGQQLGRRRIRMWVRRQCRRGQDCRHASD